MSLGNPHLPPALGFAVLSLQKRDETWSRNELRSSLLRHTDELSLWHGDAGLPFPSRKKSISMHFGTLVSHQHAHPALTLSLPRG